MQLTIELPPREQQIDFNRNRWAEVLADRVVAHLPFRIETNAYGHIIMTPPASGGHSTRQGRITVQLARLLGGQVLPECPISTIDGVKVADVGWYSEQRFAAIDGQSVFETAPEICVEVLSPGNSETEMRLKRQLYFEAGASEVWLCNPDGSMMFFLKANPHTSQPKSEDCPVFPSQIE